MNYILSFLFKLFNLDIDALNNSKIICKLYLKAVYSDYKNISFFCNFTVFILDALLFTFLLVVESVKIHAIDYHDF